MDSHTNTVAPPAPKPNLDSVGIWWLSWMSIWTVTVACGMGYLIRKRHMPILRIRGLGLSIFAIVLLHLYWMSAQLAYVVGPLAPGDAEYWIMGTYFPFGIALFQASNSQFLHVAKMQKKYANPDERIKRDRERRGNSLLAKFRRLDYSSKVLLLVGIGMAVQSFLTIFMYLISRKWHSSWGIPGTELKGTEEEQKMAMGKGWEWWPTCFWQFFWAWIFAPYVLWQSRNVHDTQGWRVQTIGCAISGLWATPMWLISLYVPGMAPVNKYWLPPQWIGSSIFFMEIFTIFLPCWEVMRHQTLRKETLDSIAQWESKKKHSAGSNKSLTSGSTAIDSVQTGADTIMSSSVESILTMSALEYVLERNPEPLQEYSALRDFSGENIAFLTSVGEWKASLPPAVRNSHGPITDPKLQELVRERFNSALRIYADFISTSDADFPINISSVDQKRLESIFEASARTLYGEKREIDAATPFDAPLTRKRSAPSSAGGSEKDMVLTDSGRVSDHVQYWGAVPEAFDHTVFDDAEKSIKYLVLTNTWPKFIRDRRQSVDTEDDVETGNNLAKVARTRHNKS